jgi:endonuclease-8
MPEGPEMRRAAGELGRVLAGRVAREVWFKFPRLAAAGRRLTGRRVRGVEARGKALILHFAGGHSIYTHNQLYGKWLVGPAGARPDTARDLRLAIETRTHAALLYSASEIAVLPTARLAQHPYVARLGVELLAPDTTLATVEAVLRERRFAGRTLGALLLDQGFLAGVGNYLRSEILFVARLSPDARPRELDAGERRRLARAALSITRRASRTGGVTNSAAAARALKAQGVPYAAYRHFVFDRRDADCPGCGTPSGVQRVVRAGRQLYACRICQPPRAVRAPAPPRTPTSTRPPSAARR